MSFIDAFGHLEMFEQRHIEIQSARIVQEVSPGITKRESDRSGKAKGYLEKAGDKSGGYRVKGIASIDQAFKMLGVSPESTPQEMESGNVDEPSMMDSGIASLQKAKADFANADNNWGGRKAKAVALIDQALQDLQTGINWAKEHKAY